MVGVLGFICTGSYISTSGLKDTYIHVPAARVNYSIVPLNWPRVGAGRPPQNPNVEKFNLCSSNHGLSESVEIGHPIFTSTCSSAHTFLRLLYVELS